MIILQAYVGDFSKTLILEKKRFFDKEKNYRKVNCPTEYKTNESILDNFELKTKPVLKDVIFFCNPSE